MTYAPGHFHAALVQKHRPRGVHRRAYVYAPLDADLLDHLGRIAAFNARPDDSTDWELDVRTSPDPLARMAREQPGNAVVVAGRNRPKIDAILAAARAGLHVLADKPWVIDADDLPKLEEAFREADLRDLVLWDMMTERFELPTVFQRELMRAPEVYGAQVAGTVNAPGLTLESVHHLRKTVAGTPLLRPAWWFDPREAGYALADVGTHLADLAFWLLFPGQGIDHRRDLRLLDAACWPTPLDRDQLAALTGLPDVPPSLAGVASGDQLLYAGNGAASFTVRGVHVRLTVQWDYEAADGSGDTHDAVARGTVSTVAIRHAPAAAGGRPELTVTPNDPAERARVRAAVGKLCERWAVDHPGVAVADRGADLHAVIPPAVRTTHEDHFAAVVREFVRYFQQPRHVPAWEPPNTLAKYYLTTGAVKMAVQKQNPPPT